MDNEYEKSAKSAAVAATEGQLQQRAAVARRTAKATVFGKVVVFGVVATAILGTIVWWVTKSDLFDDGGSLRWVAEMVGIEKLQQGSPEFTQLARVKEIMDGFRRGQVMSWREADEAIKPKLAPAGTEYFALVPDKVQGYNIFEIHAVGNGKVEAWLVSPFADNIPVKMADFKQSCGPMGYFIMHNGIVYTCSNASGSTLRNLCRE